MNNLKDLQQLPNITKTKKTSYSMKILKLNSVIKHKLTIISSLFAFAFTIFCSQANAQSGCLNVYWEADYHYYQLHGSNTENRINSVISQVETMFKNSGVDLTLTVVNNNIITYSWEDPYGASSISNYIGTVLNTAIARGYTSGTVDVTLLFSGKRLSNHGAAWPGLMCTGSSCTVGIGVNKNNGGGLSSQQEAQIQAHEITHLLTDGEHDDVGVNLMNSTVPYTGATLFSNSRVTQINQAIASKSCLSCPQAPVVTQNCAAVPNIYAYNVSKYSCTLSWSPVTGAQSYSLWYWSGAWYQFGTIYGTSSGINGLQPGSTYYLSVRADCGSSQSPILSWAQVVTPWYRSSDDDGNNSASELTAVEGDLINMVEDHSMVVYPNPAKDEATIAYELSTENYVEIIVTDAVGKQVITIEGENKDQGVHSTKIETSHLPEGVYYCVIQTKNFVEVQKLMVVK